jgi:hypothetical protein
MVMITKEGTHRIHLLAKRIMLFGSLAGIAIWVLMFILRGEGGLADLFIVIAAPLAFGATLWLVAWIVEGFKTSSEHE